MVGNRLSDVYPCVGVIRAFGLEKSEKGSSKGAATIQPRHAPVSVDVCQVCDSLSLFLYICVCICACVGESNFPRLSFVATAPFIVPAVYVMVKNCNSMKVPLQYITTSRIRNEES